VLRFLPTVSRKPQEAVCEPISARLMVSAAQHFSERHITVWGDMFTPLPMPQAWLCSDHRRYLEGFWEAIASRCPGQDSVDQKAHAK
jgi:hypothetical protein